MIIYILNITPLSWNVRSRVFCMRDKCKKTSAYELGVLKEIYNIIKPKVYLFSIVTCVMLSLWSNILTLDLFKVYFSDGINYLWRPEIMDKFTLLIVLQVCIIYIWHLFNYRLFAFLYLRLVSGWWSLPFSLSYVHFDVNILNHIPNNGFGKDCTVP